MTISTPDDIKTTLKNRGVKTTANSQRPLRFIGSDAQRTFKEVAAELAVLFSEEDSDVATLGEFYETAVYKKGTTNEKTYEPIYDGVDWSVPAEDAETKRALDEVYGNVDAVPTPTERAKVLAIFNPTLAKLNVNSPKEFREGLSRVQSYQQTYQDEDTRGIRAVDDLDAPIEPIA